MATATLNTDKLHYVIEDWDKIKAMDEWEKVSGKLLFQHLFDKCPSAKPLFGFSMKVDPRNQNILKSHRFAKHSKFLIRMIDKTVTMLGSETSDDESGRSIILTDVLTKLGKKHVSFGVKPEYFPFMTDSLLAMLSETLGSVHIEAWKDVFDFLCYQMEVGHRAIDKDVAAAKDKGVCMDVWKRLASIPSYKKTGGAILFQNLFDMCPEVKLLFGFPIDVDPHSEDLTNSPRFAIHSQFLLGMMEKTIGMLGDDNKSLTKSLTELGKKHVSFGVSPNHFPYMTDSLIAMLNDLLGKEFSQEDQQSFENVMSLLIADLVKGQRQVEKSLAGANKFIVIESWRKLTNISGYEKQGGVLLFQNVFEVCPEAKMLFGFPKDTDPKSDALLQNEHFLKHATFLLNMIGKTVGMLGEEDDELTRLLLDIGKKHVTYGVKAEYFPFMTQSIIIVMKEMLRSEFTSEDEAAWEDILSLLIADMVKGQRTLDMGLAAVNKNVTARNWKTLQQIKDYDEVGGLVIFENLFKTCPEAKPFFGFDINYPLDEIRISKRVLVHGSFIVEMVEKALDMMGSDDFELESFLSELGKKHSAYGVSPEHMPYMQQSIILMLKTLLVKENAFSKEDEKAWDSVLSALVANITRAQREIAMKQLSETMVI